MSLENVREYLKKYGKDQDIILFDQSSATVKEAAADLGTEEGRIAKTMSFLLASGPIVIVAAGDEKIRRCRGAHRASCRRSMPLRSKGRGQGLP